MYSASIDLEKAFNQMHRDWGGSGRGVREGGKGGGKGGRERLKKMTLGAGGDKSIEGAKFSRATMLLANALFLWQY